MLQQIFINLLSQYTDNQLYITDCWYEVERAYTYKKRFYHTLQHIEQLINTIEANEKLINDKATMLFSAFYHDIVYDATAKDNEEQSAKIAVARLSKTDFPLEKIKCCEAQILATKRHETTGDFDTDFFTDADLAILGSDWNEYEAYAKNIRKEYAIYPDFMYNMGRRKVLKHFLEMENIFKTPIFQSNLEEKARKNLVIELKRV
jgi:predicted metal-dependent HD superfamily phosphohydrolase